MHEPTPPPPTPPEKAQAAWGWVRRVAAVFALLGLLEILSTVLLHAFGMLPGPEPGPMWIVVLLELLLLAWAGLIG